ncbi:DUF4376 domain-containing protein [Yersinia kristensenii]|uniref:DUF4376 domain-containing protein n=2 Tax=Yersinia kristensenii TaxID=28152 RepID=UPI000BEFA01E|nr:DUF4376 domain-containing protein [Yersinia kristensenii]PEH53158.1 hypothetical protein CRM81_07215 [Yersinia kristensenii]SUP71046.1 Uncharacterised protein [Yersinia kristensenii]
MDIKNIINPRYLESGAIDCEVQFAGMEEYLSYTATPDDTTETGQTIWRALIRGDYGNIAPFEVTPAILQAAREKKWQEINAWRLEQEAQSITFEYAGRTWNADQQSMARLSPVVAVANTNSRDVMPWGDANNESVPLSMEQLKGLSEAMALALMERNNRIYQRQRNMKDALTPLTDLQQIRKFKVD